MPELWVLEPWNHVRGVPYFGVRCCKSDRALEKYPQGNHDLHEIEASIIFDIIRNLNPYCTGR